jgi:hypothetical protein
VALIRKRITLAARDVRHIERLFLGDPDHTINDNCRRVHPSFLASLNQNPKARERHGVPRKRRPIYWEGS